MASPGRNDPCPCGSGKKFKHCHLVAAQPFTGITAQDRTAAIDALMKYSTRSEFEDVTALAALMWMGDDPADDPREALADIMGLATSRETFFDWLFFDLPFGVAHSLAELFLQRRRGSLHPRAEDFIRLMLDTHLRPYQVRESRPGEGMRLRDLWTSDELWVTERSASHQVVVWDVLVGRLHTLADGTRQLEGSAILLPARSARDLTRALKAEHRRLLKSEPDLTVEKFFKIVAPVFHLYWYEEVANAAPPEVRTPEGHAFTLSTLDFDHPRAGDALATVLKAPDFEPADVSCAVWLDRASDQPRLLGDLRIGKGTLTLQTMSRERAARGRARLEELLGPLRLVREEHREGGARSEAGGPAPIGATDTIEELDASTVPDVAAWLNEQDRAWLDLEIPALDGATPRAAAKSRRLRPRLIDLLIDIENRQARMSRSGAVGQDVSWLWKELGLRRP